jgi:hypothetical protein
MCDCGLVRLQCSLWRHSAAGDVGDIDRYCNLSAEKSLTAILNEAYNRDEKVAAFSKLF